MSGRAEVDHFEDIGSQSPLKLSEDAGKKIYWEWCTDMDYKPFKYDHISSWLQMLYSGDFKQFLKVAETLDDETFRLLLEKRETLLNVTSVFHVIIGSYKLRQCEGCLEMFPESESDHLKLLQELIRRGVDLGARDLIGLTPLHYCCTHPSDLSLKMAKCLIEAGADLNAQTR